MPGRLPLDWRRDDLRVALDGRSHAEPSGSAAGGTKLGINFGAGMLGRLGLRHWRGVRGQGVARCQGSCISLAELRAGLRERMQGTICDAARFTRMLEQAYRTLWEQRTKG